MPWDTSTRASRLPGNWKTIRANVLRRDHHRCQINDSGCTVDATEVDHIIPNDDHSLHNLRAACSTCHALKTRREAQAAKPSRTRIREAHPGITA